MNKLILIALLILLPQVSLAKGDLQTFSATREGGPFAGFGFGYDNFDLQVANNTKSTFAGWHTALEAGFNVNFSNSGGFSLTGEYKLMEASNTLDSATYMEKASVKAINAKLGLYIGAFMIGGGYGNTQIDVKNVSSDSPSGTTTFKGSPTMVFANYGFETNALRANLEVQYNSGKLEDIQYNDYSVGIRLFFLFGD